MQRHVFSSSLAFLYDLRTQKEATASVCMRVRKSRGARGGKEHAIARHLVCMGDSLSALEL